MKSLIAIAAITYAIALWIFAPRSIWERELATAKHNRLTEPTPEQKPEPEPMPPTKPEPIIEIVEPTPEPEPEPSAQTVPTPEPETIPETIPESIPKPKQSKQSIQTSEDTVYTNWTTTQLRDEAKKRKLNWRPLVNGKRTPLNKPQLIQLLTT
jgi:outer membrane biosynthesis protein TonB